MMNEHVLECLFACYHGLPFSYTVYSHIQPCVSQPGDDRLAGADSWHLPRKALQGPVCDPSTSKVVSRKLVTTLWNITKISALKGSIIHLILIRNRISVKTAVQLRRHLLSGELRIAVRTRIRRVLELELELLRQLLPHRITYLLTWLADTRPLLYLDHYYFITCTGGA